MRLRDRSQDFEAFCGVYWENEYKLPERFPPESIVLDLGANVGSFAIKALHCGAARVECYEPEPENYALLVENMQPYPHVRCHQKAVWAPGVATVRLVTTYPGTAMHFVHERGDVEVEAIGLDAILVELGEVETLKLDVEGSELPILASAKELRRCRHIVGEAHLRALGTMGIDCGFKAMLHILREAGFMAYGERNPKAPGLAWFFGERR